MLAVEVMSNSVQFVFITIALILFLLAGLDVLRSRVFSWGAISFVALGLAAALFPEWWNLLASL